jgi:hypothetical protein
MSAGGPERHPSRTEEYLLADLGVLVPPTDPPAAASSTESVEELR